MTILITILVSYLLTFIFAKLGYKLDKNNELYPAPTEGWILMLIPVVNSIVTLYVLIHIVVKNNIKLDKLNKLIEPRKKNNL